MAAQKEENGDTNNLDNQIPIPKRDRSNRKSIVQKAFQLSPFVNTIKKKKENIPNKRASKFVVPGEERGNLDEEDLEDVLALKNVHHGSRLEVSTLQRKQTREQLVASRKRGSTFAQTGRQLTRRKLDWIKELPIEEQEKNKNIIEEVDTDQAKEDLKEELSQLYEKKLPSEWLSKLKPQESLKAYQHTLECILYPLDGSRKQRELMKTFNKNDFIVLRKAFGVDEREHKRAIEYAQGISRYVVHYLEHRLATLSKNPVYSVDAFDDEESFLAWKVEETNNIQQTITKLRQEPEYQGDLTVILLEARDLPMIDGKEVSPFCDIRISRQQKKKYSVTLMKKTEKQEQRTKVVKKSLDPVWCQEFHFKLPDDANAWNLKIVMWDLDPISNRYLGEVVIPLDNFSDEIRRDEWIPLTASEKMKGKKVEGDIHIVTHLTCRRKAPEVPPPIDIEYASDVELHQFYKELLYKLIQYENPDLKEKEIEPLSDAALALLDEFANRFGIGERYRNLIHLDILAEFFPYQLRKSFVEEILQLITELEASKHHNVQMSSRETELYNDTSDKIAGHIETILSNYKWDFKDRKMDGTLQLMIKIFTVIKHNKSEKPEKYIESYIKTANERIYEDLVKALDKKWQETPPELEPDGKTKTAEMIDWLLTSIEEDVQLYKQEFPANVPTVHIAAQTLRDELNEDLKVVVSNENRVTSATFDLYFKIVEFNAFLEEKVPKVPVISVQTMFAHLIKHWIEQTQSKLTEWTDRMIGLEKWEALDESEEAHLIHSYSVVDLFHSISEAVNFLITIKFDLKQNAEYFIHEVVTKVVYHYVDRVRSSAIERLAKTESTLEIQQLIEIVNKTRKNGGVNLTITKDLCVRLNNIETVQNLLVDLSAFLEKKTGAEEIDHAFDDCFFFVRQSQGELIDIISDKMNRDMMIALTALLDQRGDVKETERLEPLYAYLNLQLQMLSENLYSGLFQKLLRSVFKILVKDLEAIVVPFSFEDKYNRKMQVKLIEDSFDDIVNFFHAEGEGVPMKFVKKYTARLQKVFGLFDIPTEDLISLYESMEANPDKTEAKDELLPYHVISILACRKNEDREAKKFIKKFAQGITNKDLRKHFNLDPQEELIEKFSLANEGTFYITTSYLCFDPVRGKNRVQLPIFKILSVQKIGVVSTIEITMQDMDKHRFSGFIDRGHAVEVIIVRAKELGNHRFVEWLVSHERNEGQQTPGSSARRSTRSSNRSSVISNSSSGADETESKDSKRLQRFRKKYHVGEDENILHEFSCSYRYLGVPKSGKMKITQNYLCFNSPWTPKLSLSFEKMEDITKDNNEKKIRVFVNGKKYSFVSFKNLEQAFLVLGDLWHDHHPEFNGGQALPPRASISQPNVLRVSSKSKPSQ